MDDIIARRQFDPLYIWLDIAFLLVLAGLLLWKRKYMTVLVGLFFGLVYFAVDYGLFHLVFHARTISEGYSLFWVLLWMSMSYGFTNFAWIWLWISKDKRLFEWSALILFWWLCAPMIAATFGRGEPIVIQRTTGAYHGYMEFVAKAKEPPHRYPVAARHRRAGAVRLGSRPAFGRHPQRGVYRLF